MTFQPAGGWEGYLMPNIRPRGQKSQWINRKVYTGPVYTRVQNQKMGLIDIRI